MPYMRILALVFSCYQVDKVCIAGSTKGHNFAIQVPTKKKICVCLFFVLMIHIKFQVPSSSSSLVLQTTAMLHW